jgi:hypothetical protein
MNNMEKIIAKQKANYEELLKTTEKNKEISMAKRSKYKDVNSINVFVAE